MSNDPKFDRVREIALNYVGNLPWLAERTILFVRAGSHAYGTALPTSDRDFRGVAVPPVEYRAGFVRRFEQAQWASGADDTVIYEVRKFFALASDGNPNVLEHLFTADEDVLFAMEAGERLRGARTMFLSQKALHTFRGYAISQLKRIRTHRRWLLDPPKAAPTRADHKLPDRTLIPVEQLLEAQAAVQKKVDSWELDLSGLEDARRIEIMERVAHTLAEMGVLAEDRWRLAGKAIGLDDDLLQVMGRERAYKSAHDEWTRYQNWVATRNPERAALEAKHGYDTKHALHLVRLMCMCREILEKGLLLVRRPDADDLLAVRRGEKSYEELEAWATAEDAALIEVAKTSKLPRQPDRNALDALCLEITDHMEWECQR